ncbi:hypothetical protein [Corynebacterium freneyi]|uniref:Uncharacterized protein n=1 Tax=Corynebacterium freneyi TaxID=134034 RepID=A0ABS4U965_9CORY|nr:hypothetical protein [Corynebacterium freneyi]MBP2333065.1 hypothetical protein [Corynebacterium freneyi]QXA52840.1 hypothetical protein I6L56_12670 [Corynebacterium freneyi]WJZ04833.1 hypothetical protein CFREN_04275 [Corynebacterium freneyi]
MTPDEARDLLDGAAPGEWQWDDTGNVAAVDGDGWEHVADYVYEEDGALIVAAPGMAAMIAGMRAEYAVQNRVGDKWLYEDDDGRNLAPYDSHRIAWWPDPIPQSDIADRGEGMARIVRRYVTTPEEA